jgi:hypothetical protein
MGCASSRETFLMVISRTAFNKFARLETTRRDTERLSKVERMVEVGTEQI